MSIRMQTAGEGTSVLAVLGLQTGLLRVNPPLQHGCDTGRPKTHNLLRSQTESVSLMGLIT